MDHLEFICALLPTQPPPRIPSPPLPPPPPPQPDHELKIRKQTRTQRQTLPTLGPAPTQTSTQTQTPPRSLNTQHPTLNAQRSTLTTTHHSPLTTHHSPLAICHLPLSTNSPLLALHSLLSTPCLSLPTSTYQHLPTPTTTWCLHSLAIACQARGDTRGKRCFKGKAMCVANRVSRLNPYFRIHPSLGPPLHSHFRLSYPPYPP